MTKDKALEAALPGEAEVVGWAYRGPRGGLIVTEEKPKHAPEAVPLVTLASLQAMQALAEKAERERDAAIIAMGEHARARGVAEGALHASELAGVVEGWQARAEAAEARVKEMEEERDALRKVISECASALPNGAFISPKASVEFMAMLPAEIASVCTALKGGSNG